MLKNRKPKPNTVFTYSIALGLVLAAAAAWEVYWQSWFWAALWGVLAVWFFVDAMRARSWMQNAEAQQASAEAEAQATAEAKAGARVSQTQASEVFAKSAPAPADSGVRANPLIDAGADAGTTGTSASTSQGLESNADTAGGRSD